MMTLQEMAIEIAKLTVKVELMWKINLALMTAVFINIMAHVMNLITHKKGK